MTRYILIFAVIALLCSFTSSAKVVHKERSLYRHIVVEDFDDLRCLQFNVKTAESTQSCFYKSAPNKLVFNYTKLLFSGLLINQNPKSVLIIGLGGGTMSNTLQQLFPQTTITNVEIDPAVIKVARQYFDFFENDHVRTVIQDGRIFVKRAALKNHQYDWIILDAFNGDYIPEHLLTKEFLQETKQLLTENGVLSANTFSVSKLYAHESETYRQVFGDFYNVRNKKNSNRIILASNKTLPNQNVIKNRALALQQRLALFGVNLLEITTQMTSAKTAQDWPKNTQILTDQFSPANLLNID